MENRLIKIGEAARMLGRSVWTLREWERKGVLIPTWKSPSGTRYYSQKLIESMLRGEN